MKKLRVTHTVLMLLTVLALLAAPAAVALAGTFTPVTATDQTPAAPLANPAPSSFQPRYISGFGSDNSFTVFFEDRDNGNAISYASTTSGPTGFPASATATNVADTHSVIKDWPINVGGTDYAYRAWGSVGNNMDHHFYVSNDLSNWTLVSTFTIPNAAGFTDAHGWVYYGFHDVIQLNGTYYAFAESNQSQTMLVRSVNGDDVWEAFASIGGRPGWGPLELPSGISYGWTPSGSFVDLGHDRGYGKVYVHPGDTDFYLAVNTEAKPSLPPADLEAAFINPANWTWHDGTTGPAANPILSATTEHDLRECWVVPNTDPDADWVIVYDADFGTADGGKALGYATLTPPTPPPATVYVDDGYDAAGCSADGHTWQVDCFDVIQDGVDAVAAGGTVMAGPGTYNSSVETFPILIDKPLAMLGTQANVDPRPSQGGRSGDESVIDADETSGAVLRISAGDVEINGFTITGGTGDMVEESGSADNLLFCYNTLYDDPASTGDEAIQIKYSDGVVIEYNYAYNIVQDAFNLSSSSNGAVRYNDAHDIYSENAAIYCYDATNIDIIGNLVYNVPNNDGIKLGDADDGSTGGVVSGNEVHDVAEDGITVYASSATVENNTIYNCGSENGALYLYGADGTPVRKNKIYDNAAIGLLIRNSDNVTVEENEIYNNDDSDDTKYVGSAGIWLTSDASNVVIHTNCIAGNAEFGVNNEAAAIVDAEDNWWGDPSGPHHPTANPAGTGDAISDNVDFDPWIEDGCPLITGSIHVGKYLDEDEDGERDPDEPGLPDWEFTLTDVQGTPVAQGTTDGDGNLSFTDLPLGIYEVCETLPEGWVNSDPGDTCQTVIIGSGGAAPGPGPATLTTDDGDSFLLQFLGTTNGGLTWNYRVTELQGRDLSHWVLGLCMDKDAVTGWDPVADDAGIEGVELVDPDPTTGVSGIKWDVDDDFNDDGNAGGDSREFSFTLDTVYPVGTTEVAIKTGGADKTADSSIAGPHCGDGPSEVTLVFGNYEEDDTAVTLSYFTAEPRGVHVALAWETGTEIDNAGFNLYRASAPDGPYVKVNAALIAAQGDPTSGASYTFLDRGLAPGTYFYKLEDIDLSGVTMFHGPISATVLPRFRRPAYRPILPKF